MVAKTNTYLCLHCKEVVDVVTEHLTVVKTGESAVGKCPRCKSSEHITEWDTKKRPCPRCDGKMEYALTQRITLWD
jgi:acetyl-CoA carboxylase beta subunit